MYIFISMIFMFELGRYTRNLFFDGKIGQYKIKYKTLEIYFRQTGSRFDIQVINVFSFQKREGEEFEKYIELYFPRCLAVRKTIKNMLFFSCKSLHCIGDFPPLSFFRSPAWTWRQCCLFLISRCLTILPSCKLGGI